MSCFFVYQSNPEKIVLFKCFQIKVRKVENHWIFIILVLFGILVVMDLVESYKWDTNTFCKWCWVIMLKCCGARPFILRSGPSHERAQWIGPCQICFMGINMKNKVVQKTHHYMIAVGCHIVVLSPDSFPCSDLIKLRVTAPVSCEHDVVLIKLFPTEVLSWTSIVISVPISRLLAKNSRVQSTPTFRPWFEKIQ